MFLVVCHGDVFRQMVLVSRDIGMAAGEYVFIFYYSVPGDPALGDFSWARGDTLDMV